MPTSDLIAARSNLEFNKPDNRWIGSEIDPAAKQVKAHTERVNADGRVMVRDDPASIMHRLPLDGKDGNRSERAMREFAKWSNGPGLEWKKWSSAVREGTWRNRQGVGKPSTE
ncbi:MAG: hypothetical protein GX456_11360 [Verrucomicrobia bacterium]|nr:hypothetical protein [Verrucomicrobiota bacterium]